MDGNWLLTVWAGVVRLAVLGSAQDSSSVKPLYLISVPEVLHSGTPTLLAVMVHTDYPVIVTARVTQGNTSLALASDTFQGGLTGVLTLPPVPESSVSPSALSTLAVSGHQGGHLLFTDTTSLYLKRRTVRTFMQMDRRSYRPAETVRIRIVSVWSDNRPYAGPVELSVRDPRGDTVRSWGPAGSRLGIVSSNFSLSQTPPLGRWRISATVDGLTSESIFIVENSEPPQFEVLLRTEPEVLEGEDISGTVRTQHLSGHKTVHGTLSVTAIAASPFPSLADRFILNDTKEIHGSAQFFFGQDGLLPLYDMSSPHGVVLHVDACVTERSTGLKVNHTVRVRLNRNKFRLLFRDVPRVLKPSLSFSAKLRVSRYDRPLNSLELMSSASVRVAQRTSDSMEADATTVTLSVPEDGEVLVRFTLRDRVQALFIQATFMSGEATLELHRNFTSPSGSYLQILPLGSLPAQIGLSLHIEVESTFQLSDLHYVVSSGGRVLAAGTEASFSSSSFSLTPTASWSPEVCLTVYCVLPDGEVASDSVHVPVRQRNNVSLNWSSDRARPGDRVSLTATALQAGARVAIKVFGAEGGDALPLPERAFTGEKAQECPTTVLTNGRLHMTERHNESTTEVRDSVRDYATGGMDWSQWMHRGSTVIWLWLDANMSTSTWTSPLFTVPDRLTSWSAVALVMSENLGPGLTAAAQRLTVSQEDLTLSLDVPEFLIRGEEIVLEVKVSNRLRWDIEVILLVAQSDAYEFVLSGRSDVAAANARKVTVGSEGVATALFPIRLLAPGEVEISVDAVSADASDSLLQTLHVKPEGVERSVSETLFLELAPTKRNNSMAVSFSFPPDVVPGSQRAHVALVGDVLGFSIGTLDSLVRVPHSCGEQNMVHFAASVYVLQYLDKSLRDNEEIRRRALSIMEEAYQRELSFLRDDGSFSAFGASDTSGSTWLTAFVLRCFLKAQSFMQVDQRVLSRAATWLAGRQGPRGEFSEVGQVIHTQMQGGHDGSAVGLTAFVLMALLEEQSYADMLRGNVSLAVSFLESSVHSQAVSNYSLSLVAYALALANRPAAGTVLDELKKRAHYKDGIIMWSSSESGPDVDEWPPPSAQIEMASYMLLTLFRRGSMVDGITLMKWLSQQRNYLGGFGTTQDTVVALQALACYATFSGADAINLRVKMSTSRPSSLSQFKIDSLTYLQYQEREIDVEGDLSIDLYIEGRGFALFQMNVFYNAPSQSLSQRFLHGTDGEAFSLDLDVLDNERDQDHMLLSICTRLLEHHGISQTGMAMIEVGVLSGFILSPQAALTSNDLIRKMEVSPRKVSLYLDSLTLSEVCIRLPLIRSHKVARVQDAVVHVYDYYEPRRRAMRTYNSDLTHGTDSCSFCGRDCSLCAARLPITVSSTSSARSANCAAYSLGCLLAGMTAFLL